MISTTVSHKYSHERGLGRVGLRRKVPGTNPLLKPKVFPQLPPIQRSMLPSQKPKVPHLQRVIHTTYVERKQIILQLKYRPRYIQGQR